MYKKLLSDFSAGINMSWAPLQLGLDSSKTPWASGINVEIFSQKGICRQAGNTLLTENPDSKAINSIFWFKPADRVLSQRLLYSTTDGDFYEYDMRALTHTALKTGLTVDKPCIYTPYLDGVAVANGADEPFFYHIQNSFGKVEITRTVAKDGSSPIIANAMCAYKSRLWLADNDTIYFSALGMYNDWESTYDAGYISNFHCDSAPITALHQYKDYIAIYKQSETYLLSGSSPEDFAITHFANKGAAGQNAVVTANNKQYFFSDALFSLEQTGILAQIALGNEVSLNIKPALNGTDATIKTYVTSGNEEYKMGGCLDKSKLSLVHALVCERKNQLRIFIPTQNNLYLNNIWIYDWVNSAWMLRVLPQPVLCAANQDGDIICATEDGQILIDDFGPDFNGEPIQFEWKSPFLTLGNPNSRKIIDDFYLLISDTHDNHFFFSTYRDYDTLEAQDREEINVSNKHNLVWGSDTVDDDVYIWSDEETADAESDSEDAESENAAESAENAETAGTSENSEVSESDDAGESGAGTTTVLGSRLWAVPCETAQKTEVSGSCLAVQFCIEGYLAEHNFALLALQYNEIMQD